MKELINLSNTAYDLQDLLGSRQENLTDLLQRHDLDGVEMMFAAPWDEHFPARQYIQGVHLRFWPSWLDFWQGNRNALQRLVPDKAAMVHEFGAVSRDGWLDIFRQNLRVAIQSNATYFVFHVTNMRPWELLSRNFASTDREVIQAAVEVINAIADEIPENRLLLFENLWWSGLTLQNVADASYLLEHVQHHNCGFMFDTGHFLCSNPQVRTEAESIDYLLQALRAMGELRGYIRGVHLHCSLSGQYVLQHRQDRPLGSLREALSYTINVDCHQPFTLEQVTELIDLLEPAYLVHEFIPNDLHDLDSKLHMQRHALGRE